jgi:hypothetical protein
MERTKPRRRWFYPTPNWLVIGSLLATAILFASEQWRWFPFNEHKGWTVLIAVAAAGAMLIAMLLWFLAAMLFRLRFQFSLRLLLALVVCVAVPFSWLASEMKIAGKQKTKVDELLRLKGQVEYYSERTADRRLIAHRSPPEPEWLRDWLGVDFFGDVNIVCLGGYDVTGVTITDNTMDLLVDFKKLKWLALVDTEVTDSGLERLRNLTNIETLMIGGNRKCTDGGLKHLKGLPRIKWLELNDLHVTNAGLKEIQGVTTLETLLLNETDVTDGGLQHLHQLKRLRLLQLYNTKVTTVGIESLRAALPDCKIEQ